MNLFKDSNDLNEKTIMAYIAFAVLVILVIADLFIDSALQLNSEILLTLRLIILGALGIGTTQTISKIIKK